MVAVERDLRIVELKQISFLAHADFRRVVCESARSVGLKRNGLEAALRLAGIGIREKRSSSLTVEENASSLSYELQKRVSFPFRRRLHRVSDNQDAGFGIFCELGG